MTYTITPHGPYWLLRLPTGASALFVARDDAEAEGDRLARRAAAPPIAWIRAAPGPHDYPIPQGAPPATCVSCGASIIWARTPAGAAVPLSVATARTLSGRRVATSHFQDCPDAAAWGT